MLALEILVAVRFVKLCPLLYIFVLTGFRLCYIPDSNTSWIPRGTSYLGRSHSDVSRGPMATCRQRRKGVFLHVDDPGTGQNETLASAREHV